MTRAGMGNAGPVRSVIVTGVGGPAGRGVASVLHGRGHRVLGVDMVRVLLDGVPTAVVPRADDPTFVPVLHALARELGADLIVPTVTEELPVLAAIRDPLIAIGDPDAVDLAADKWLTVRALRRAGVATPRTLLGGTTAPWSALRAELGAPVLAKPRRGRGGRGVSVHHAVPHGLTDAFLLQEFAPGVEYCPAVHRSADGVARVAVLEKLALAGGEVGNAVAVRRVACPDVARVAVAAVAALGLTGAADVDVRRLGDGTPVVLEVNARFGAHAAHVPELVDAVLAEHAVPTAMA